MENPEGFKDRREFARSRVDLPVEYRIDDFPNVHGGLVVNASEGGLLIHSARDMALGLKLGIVVLFLAEYELTHLQVTAEIIWKDLHFYNKTEGYQYGLKIIRILEEDLRKLKRLLRGQFTRGENIHPLPFRSPVGPSE